MPCSDQPDGAGDLTQCAEVGLDAGVGTANVVEVFGVAQLLRQVELVQASASAEGELCAE